MKNQLKTFIPWRKGPFLIHDIYINAEWRSDWKWDRLQPYIEPLKDRCVLDVGCGSGYHCWRMAGEGAKLVIGIDPYLLYLAQFQAIKHFLKQDNVFVLPFSLETLPEGKLNFDTVFSMGVLYHRRSPLDHLLALRSCLRSGGQLVLETLVTEGENGYTLLPEGRYAGMRNTWFIPSPLTLESWLRKCGFQQIRFLEKTPTTTNEQRSTEWMPYLSLKDHLHKTNPQLTNEGHPAPVRAIFLANAP